MKEEDARTKWCPFVRVKRVEDSMYTVAVNRRSDGSHEADTLCIASDCMAWRSKAGDGWCGLAGDPPGGPNVEVPAA